MTNNNTFPISRQQRAILNLGDNYQKQQTLSIGIKIVGQLDVPRLEEALNLLLRRHEILRTCFNHEEGFLEPNQAIMDDFSFGGFNGNGGISVCGEVSFSLRENNVAGYLLTISAPRTHIDSQSMMNLFSELVALYDGKIELEDEPLQYVDFSDWQDEFVSEDSDGEIYWQAFNHSDYKSSVSVEPSYGKTRQYQKTFDGFVETEKFVSALLVTKYKFQHVLQQQTFIQLNGRLSTDFVGGLGAYAVQLPLSVVFDEQTQFNDISDSVLKTLDELSLNQLSVPEYLSENNKPSLTIEFINKQNVKAVSGVKFELAEIKRNVSPRSIFITVLSDSSETQINCFYGDKVSSAVTHQLIDSLCHCLDSKPFSRNVAGITVLKDLKAYYVSVGDRRDMTSQPLLHEAFESFVSSRPDAIAVRDASGVMTYRELYFAVNHCVNQLVQQNVTCGNNVAVSFNRRRELLISILAILRLGAAYVPIEPSSPTKRFTAVLEQCQLLIASNDVISELDDEICQATNVCTFEIGSAEFSNDSTKQVKPEQTAYVLFTSGSTGKPKGVQVSQANLRQYLSWASAEYFPDVHYALVATAISFDLTVTGLLGPLYCGKEVHLIDNADPIEGIKSALNERKDPAFLKITPSHLKALNPWFSQNINCALRMLVLGGEELHNRDLEGLSNHENVVIINEYGPTEATVGCSTALCQYRSNENSPLSIGKAIANAQLLVLDENKQQVAPYQIGELYIAGEGVAQGYLAMPEMTNERFSRIDVCNGGLTRVYQTGDYASFDNNGHLSFHGRIDEQVKVRGFRIELAEIENQLLELEAISSARVIARDIGSETKQLVGIVVTAGNKGGDIQEIATAHLKNILPDYMLPSSIIAIDTLPLTKNGKVDKKQLEDIVQTMTDKTPYVAPTTALEKMLCKTWQDVLQREKVGVNDNYFSLGGDSIFSLQIAAQLKGSGIQLDVHDIFTYQTVALLAQQIEASNNKAVKEHTSIAPFSMVNEAEKNELSSHYQDAYPMSTLQLGMVFHSQLDEHDGVYHDIFTNHVKFPWQESAFRNALDAVIQRHPILRTGFILEREVPLQVVHKSINTPLKIVDVIHLGEAQQNVHVEEWINETLTKEFEWLEGPLFEVVVFLRGTDSFEFCLSFHHSLLDGWSRAALTTDLHESYQQLLKNHQQSNLQENWLFRDFISLEQAALQSEEAMLFFSSMLADSPTNQLPQQGRIKSGKIALSTCHAFEKYSSSLIALSKQMGVSVKSLLLAIHFKVISEASGRKVALSCVSNHGRPEVQDADKGLGLFLNLLPLKIDISQVSWREYVLQVHHLLMESQRHRHFPLSSIQKITGQDYSEVTFNYTHFHIYNDILGQENSELELLDSTGFEQTNFNFQTEFSRAHDNDQINMVIKYDSGLFAENFINKLSEYYLQTAKYLLSEIDAIHCRISLMDPTEQRLLKKWQSGDRQVSSGRTVHAVFIEQANIHPDVIAVDDGLQKLTYKKLAEKSVRLASYLNEMEIGKGDFVGIFLERSSELLVAILGTLQAGAAYVPIDPRTTKERLTHIVKDTQMEMMLLKTSDLENVPLSGLDTLLLDECCNDDEWLKDYESTVESLPDISLQETAYLIYTSGSTGVPKGVQISHAGLTDYCDFALSNYYDEVCNGSVVVTSHGFDITVPSLYLPLLKGHQVNLLPWGEELDNLIDKLQNNPCSLVRMTPTHGKSLLAVLDGARYPEIAPVFVIGGETLEYELVNALQKHFPQGRFYNHYGPTETVVGCCIYPLRASNLCQTGAVPIGRPMSNTQVYVVDEFGKLAPSGTIGELVISGICVAKGYLNQQEQTQQRFVQNSFESSPYRSYKTGDRVRWNEDGNLEYIGRNDDLVKFNGYRIELGEIESALTSVAGIHQAAVKIFSQGPSQRLVAYLVDDSDQTDNNARGATIKEEIQLKVAEYMVPQNYVFIDTLPVSLNGKLDRNALIEPDTTGVDTETYQAPQTEVERVLCKVIESVLPVTQVGRNDNFFNMGGDSIIAIQVASRAKREGFNITVKQLFANPVVSELAKVVSEHVEEQVEQSDLSGTLKLLPVQKRFFERRFNNKHHYNQAVLLKTPTNFDTNLLTKAVVALFKRHDGLRLSFKDIDGQPYGEFTEISEQAIENLIKILDLTHIAQAEQFDELARISNEMQASFALEKAPLFKVVYFKLSNTSGRLLLLAHHLIVDGISWRIITADLEDAYQSLLDGKGIKLAPKSASLQTWSVKLEALASSRKLKDQVGFWEDKLSGEPFSVPGISDEIDNYHSFTFSLNNEQTNDLLGNANNAFRTSVNELLIAAIGHGFCQSYKAKTLVLELEGHGRDAIETLPDVTETVGWFTTIYPISLHLDESANHESAIAEAKRVYREVPMNGMGYGLLSAYSDNDQFKSLTSHIRDSAVLFNYLGQIDNTNNKDALFSLADESIGNVEGDVAARKNLNIVSYVQSGKLTVRVSYLGEKDRLEKFVRHVESALIDMLSFCVEVNEQKTLFKSAEDLFVSQDVDFEEGIEI